MPVERHCEHSLRNSYIMFFCGYGGSFSEEMREYHHSSNLGD